MKQVNITDFGAKSCTAEFQTECIQAAIDNCFKDGGGEVIIPSGEYLVGCIRLRSNITLHLMENAVLKGSRDPDIYSNYLNDTMEPIPDEVKSDKSWALSILEKSPACYYSFFRSAASRWHNSVIKAMYADNVTIIGEKGSLIDGCDCFDEFGEEYYRGPHAIDMSYCSNVHLSGYNVVNSANWAHSMLYCHNIDVQNVEVRAGHDGVHFTNCKNINVENCRFYTGDDCVAGFNNMNMTVINCECNTACSAFRLGGTNVLITKCKIWGPAKYTFRGALSEEEKRSGITNQNSSGKRYNMLSVFTYYASFEADILYQPGNVIMTDCTVENCDKLLHYNYSGNETWQRNRPLANIQIKNTTASWLSMPSIIYGDENIKVNAEIENCVLSYANECDSFIYAANFKEISLKNTKISGKCTDAVIKIWGEEGRIDCAHLKTDAQIFTIKATSEFKCNMI